MPCFFLLNSLYKHLILLVIVRVLKVRIVLQKFQGVFFSLFGFAKIVFYRIYLKFSLLYLKAIQARPTYSIIYWQIILSNLQGTEAPMSKSNFNKDTWAATLLESRFCVRCSPVSLVRVSGAPYHEMVSEGLLSTPHGL